MYIATAAKITKRYEIAFGPQKNKRSTENYFFFGSDFLGMCRRDEQL